MWLGGVNDRKRGLRFEKKSELGFSVRGRRLTFGLLTEALRRVPQVVWGEWKSQHRKIMRLSPCVEKCFNS